MAHASFEERREVTLPQRLDKTLAYKAINLIVGLSGNDRRVATAIIDHFNKCTGRCDPSLARIASMLQISERTVIRAVNHLVALGFFLRHRHGGYSGRNSYQPVWSRFRQAEAAWLTQSRLSGSLAPSKLSPRHRQDCHLGSDTPVIQTLPVNPCYLTPADTPLPNQQPLIGPTESEPPLKVDKRVLERTIIRSIHRPESPLHTAEAAAEARWNRDLLKRYASDAETYALVIECVDELLRAAATHAELKQKGGGASLIEQHLRNRHLGRPLPVRTPISTGGGPKD
jgi:predicted transcriptional regulator